MKTHELAKQLLALPDVPVVIEGWVPMRGYETTAKMTEYDPEGQAIIVQKCVDPKAEEEMRKWVEENSTWVWHTPK